MNQPRHLPGRRRQSGVALIVVLILLMVMTLLGLASLRGTLMEERMSANLFDRSLAFQAAESALREADRGGARRGEGPVPEERDGVRVGEAIRRGAVVLEPAPEEVRDDDRGRGEHDVEREELRAAEVEGVRVLEADVEIETPAPHPDVPHHHALEIDLGVPQRVPDRRAAGERGPEHQQSRHGSEPHARPPQAGRKIAPRTGGHTSPSSFFFSHHAIRSATRFSYPNPPGV